MTVQERTSQIRAVYEEYPAETGLVATISDPQNAFAWIQSDYTVPVEH